MADEPLPRGADTRARIMDHAERLFGLHGFSGTSLRMISTAAEANLAAVNYHFGTKESLFLAVFRRMFEVLNRERIELLDELEARSVESTLAEISYAYALPPMRLIERGVPAMRFFGRCGGGMERLREVFWEVHTDVRARYFVAAKRASGGLDSATLAWRIHFINGAIVQALRDSASLEELSEGACAVNDSQEAARQLAAFAVSGLRAD